MGTLLDQAQTIAACIQYVDKRLGEIEEDFKRCIGDLPEPAPVADIDVDALQESLSENVLSKIQFPEFELPDSVVYEVHLSEAVEQINRDLGDINKQLRATIADRVDTTAKNISEQIESLDAHTNRIIRSVLDNLDKATADINMQIERVTEQMRASYEHLEQSLGEAEQNSLERDQEIQKSLDEAKLEFSSAIGDINSTLSNLDVEFRGRFVNAFNSIAKINETLSDTSQRVRQNSETIESTQKDLSGFKVSHAQDIKIIQEAFKRADQNLAELDKKKSDANHVHDYADVDHTHDELALKTDVARVRDNIGQQGSALALVANEVQNVKNELNRKASKNEVITDDDIEDLAKRIHDSVLLAIPKPADGKDALEWEFKFHETQRGLLMYKREDWRHWRTQNLLGPTQQVQQHQTPIAMGGGPVTVSQNGGGITSYYNDVEIEDRSDFFYTTTTDQDGYFELNTNIFETVAQVFHVEGHTRMIPDPTLTPDQRIVEVFIDEILPNGTIKGYAFNIRNSRSLIGTQDKTVTPPPSGTQVQIKITGA